MCSRNLIGQWLTREDYKEMSDWIVGCRRMLAATHVPLLSCLVSCTVKGLAVLTRTGLVLVEEFSIGVVISNQLLCWD